MRRRPHYPKLSRVELDPLVIPYREAYPVIAIKAVKREHSAYRRICEWVSQHIVVGEMTVINLTGQSLTVRYSCGTDTYKRRTDATFWLKAGTKRTGASDLRIVCPNCVEDVNQLYLRAGNWACRTCHALSDRRSFYGHRERLIERRDRLIRELYGQDDTHRSATWIAYRRAEVYEIEQELDGSGGWVMDEPYRHVISCCWHRDDGTREGISRLRPIPAYLDDRTPLGGLPRDRSPAKFAGTEPVRVDVFPQAPKPDGLRKAVILPYITVDD